MSINALIGSMPTQTPTRFESAPRSTGESAGPTGGFAQVIDRVLEEISAPGRAADQAVSDMATGRTDNLHQVMLAVAQADLTFRMVLEVRNKLIEAYQEIQRMQV